MGLDLGKKTIGVAVSDEAGYTAQPLRTIRRTSLASDLDELASIIQEYSVHRIVVGMPLNMDGTKGPRAVATEKFIAKLKARFDVALVAWDERLSTIAVTKVLIEGGVRREQRKEVVDKIAASYILQGYMDSKQNTTDPVANC